MSRPSRRCAKPVKRDVTEYDYYKNYYTMGYVDDNESVEAIMERFQRQEKRIEMGIADQEEDIPFDANLYYNYCNVESPQLELVDSDEEIIEDDEDVDDTFEMDDDQDDMDEYLDDLDDEITDDRQRYIKRQRIVQKPRKKAIASLSGHFGSFGIITTKRTGPVNKDACTVILADPSWAKTIQPLHDSIHVLVNDVNHDHILTEIRIYDELEPDVKYDSKKGNIPGQVIDVKNVLDFDFSKLGKFNAVLIDPPWDKFTTEDFDELPINDMITDGYCFVWVEKYVISQVLDKMKRCRFNYIENLCWVMEEPNHRYRMDEYEYLAKSHLTLLLFKKDNDTTRRMDIRHQRNPDVVFSIMREDVPREKPSYIYHMIETLLPSANGFLELWGSRIKKDGKKTVSRWTNIIEEGDKEFVPPYKILHDQKFLDT